MKEKKELVRIVKAPDLKDENGEVIQAGEISVDFIGKKPGRGAYICRSNACLASAKKARRLERAFSCKISEEIYNKLDDSTTVQPETQKILSFLGLARRAGRLSLGFDPAVDAMIHGRSSLLLLCNDLSERSRSKILKIVERTKTETISLNISMNEVGMAIGKTSGIISVDDEGFAKKLVMLCNDMTGGN